MRKKKEKKPPKIHTSIWLEIEQLSQLHTLSKENGTTLSLLIRTLIDHYLKFYNNEQKLKEETK